MRSGIIALRLVQAVFVVPPLVGSAGAFADGDVGRGLASLLEAGILFVATEATLQILVGFAEGWEKPRESEITAADPLPMRRDWLQEWMDEENERSMDAFSESLTHPEKPAL